MYFKDVMLGNSATCIHLMKSTYFVFGFLYSSALLLISKTCVGNLATGGTFYLQMHCFKYR